MYLSALPREQNPLHRAGRRVCLAWLVSTLWGWRPCAAQAETPPLEYRVKAAFLYKFGSYVEWPTQAFDRPDTPFAIGVMGSDMFADVLTQTASGRNINGRPIEVRKLKKGDSLSGLHVMFVGHSAQTSEVQEPLASAKGLSVLTVTEEPSPIEGSVINFVVVGDKIRFDIAVSTAGQNNLKISARLLSVARKIIAGPAS